MIQHSHSVFGRVKYWSSVDWTSDLARRGSRSLFETSRVFQKDPDIF